METHNLNISLNKPFVSKNKGEVQFGKVIIEGKEINYLSTNPKGNKDIIFIHGLNSSCYVWKKVISKIFSNFHCWAISLPKYGKYKLPEYEKIICEFIKKKKIKNPYWVGYSFGGIIVLDLLSRKHFKGKVILVSVPIYLNPYRLIKPVVNTFWYLINKIDFLKKIFFFFLRLRKVFQNSQYFFLNDWVKSYVDLINRKISFDLYFLRAHTRIGYIYGNKDLFLKKINRASLYNKIKPKFVTIIKAASHPIPTTNANELANIINIYFNH